MIFVRGFLYEQAWEGNPSRAVILQDLLLLPRQRLKLAKGAKDKEHVISQTLNTAIAVIGIDIGKNSFHVVGLDGRGAIVLKRLRRHHQGAFPAP